MENRDQTKNKIKLFEVICRLEIEASTQEEAEAVVKDKIDPKAEIISINPNTRHYIKDIDKDAWMTPHKRKI